MTNYPEKYTLRSVTCISMSASEYKELKRGGSIVKMVFGLKMENLNKVGLF